MSGYNWLALGDSYTIGEGVPLYESYPYQTLEILRRKELPIQAPEIIAKTGWTSSELMNTLQERTLLPAYHLVTLLIGVNNQYRGQSLEEYTTDFTWLTEKALSLVKAYKGKVIVLSIPDWGVTPFAHGREVATIATEIDGFNAINRRITAQYNLPYVDVSALYREKGGAEGMYVEDLLHPSGKMYKEWAEMLTEAI